MGNRISLKDINPKEIKRESISLADIPKDSIKRIGSTKEPKSVLQQAAELPRIGVEDVPSLLFKGVARAGEEIEKTFTAPTRAGLEALGREGLPQAIEAFGAQFREDPRMAPRGKEVVEAFPGIKQALIGRSPTDPTLLAELEAIDPELRRRHEESARLLGKEKSFRTAEDVLGLGVEIGADVSQLIPIGATIKGGKLIGRGITKAGKALLRGGKRVGSAAVKGTAKLGLKGVAKVADVFLDSDDASLFAKNLIQNLDKPGDALRSTLNPKISPSFDEAQRIQKRFGFDPDLATEAHEFGRESEITRKARALREGPLGQEMREKFSAGVKQVSDGVDDYALKLSPDGMIDDVTAGGILREGFEKGKIEFFNNIDTSYSQISRQYPGLKISPKAKTFLKGKTDDLLAEVQEELIKGVSKDELSEGRLLVNRLEALKESIETGSFEDVSKALRRTGRIAFGPRGRRLTPEAKRIYNAAYFDVADGLNESIAQTRQLGPDAADRLIINNLETSEFLKNRKLFDGLLDNPNVADEQLFKRAVMSDSKKAEALLKVLPAETVDQMKGAILEQIIKRTDDGFIRFAPLRTEMQKKSNVLSVLFEPDELNDLTQMVKYGDDYDQALFTPSGPAIKMTGLGRQETREAVEMAALETLKEKARMTRQAEEAVKIPFRRKPPQGLLPPSEKGILGLSGGAIGARTLEKTRER